MKGLDFIDFQFEAGSEQPVPPWAERKTFTGRISVFDLMRFNSSSVDATAEDIFDQHREWIGVTAARKLAELTSAPTAPLLLKLEDFQH